MQRLFVRSMLSILVTLSLACSFQLQLLSGGSPSVPFACPDHCVQSLGSDITDRTPDSAESQPPPSRSGGPRMEELSEDFADYSIAEGSLVRVAPTQSLNLSQLRSGGSFSGVLLRPLFSQDREVVPVGSLIQLMVEKVEREKSAENASRRLMSRLWNPLSTKPARFSLVFQSAVLVLPDERTVPASVSFGRLFQASQARARSKRVSSGSESSDEQLQDRTKGTHTFAESFPAKRTPAGGHRQILILRLENPIDLRLPREVISSSSATREQTTVAGSFRARVSLLTQLSASLSREGDWLRARLVEPLQIDGVIVPEGSLFEGRVTRRTPPRRLRRPGTLHVNFESIVPPTGLPIAISSSIVSVETDRRAAPKMDSEGMLRGRAPGLAAFAVDVGVSYLSGKLIDDLLEEGIKAAAAGTSIETAASIGRYFGVATGLSLFLMRRGNDVSLEAYSEFEVSFKPQARPLSR